MALLGACTSGGDNADTTVTTTKAATTITKATTTTAVPTGMELLEDQLIAFNDQYILDTSNIDTAQPGEWDRLFDWFENNTVEPIKTRLVTNYSADRADGLRLQGPGNIAELIDIDWKGSTTTEEVATNGVSVSSCLIDFLATFNADNTVEQPRAGRFGEVTVIYDYDVEAKRFYVANQIDGELCEPAQLLLEQEQDVTSEEDLQAVLAVHNEFLTVAQGGIDQRVEGYESTRQVGQRLAVGVALEDFNDFVDRWEEEGKFADGAGYESHVLAVRIDGDNAAVADCNRGAITTYDAKGNVIEPADDYYLLTETFLVKREDQWLIDYFWQQGDEECDPQ